MVFVLSSHLQHPFYYIFNNPIILFLQSMSFDSSQIEISIIIPVLNEANHIERLLKMLARYCTKTSIEILVVDGGSRDGTLQILEQSTIPAQILYSGQASRAVQMNLGASHAQGTLLYFIHADVIPPASFVEDIRNRVASQYDAGCFSYRFDHPSQLLKFNSWCTTFMHGAIGGGDQSLFIKRSIFKQLGGFNENMKIMEDFELVKRIRKAYRFALIDHPALVSARKYEHNSWLKVQLVNTYIFMAYRFGASQEYLSMSYQKLLN